jgi:uncharacterized protein with von Willebrand factor type A (vWA) domain
MSASKKTMMSYSKQQQTSSAFTPRESPHSSSAMRRVVTTEVRVVEAERQRSAPRQRKPLVFQWVQDVSGSMSGSRIEHSIGGLRFTVDEILEDNDLFGLTTFNSNSKVVHKPLRKRKLDLSKDVHKIEGEVGGGTSIYDALGQSISGLREMVRDPKYVAMSGDAVYELLLVTDGADGNSRTTLDQAIELVAHPGIPNFHLVVVAVSMSAREQEQLRRLCAFPHATFVEVEHLDQFAATIGKIGRAAVQRATVVVTRTVVEEVRVSGHGGGGGMAALQAGMGRMAIAAGAMPGGAAKHAMLTAPTPHKASKHKTPSSTARKG